MKDDNLSDAQQIKPHLYFPDYQAMGDCRICGHDAKKPWHLNMSEANCPHGIAMDIYCEQCEKRERYVNITYDDSFAKEAAKFGSVGKQESVLNKEIWNAAIEAAALRAERRFQHKTIAEAIRKLKK